MLTNEIKRYISETGYRTGSEIKAQFSDEDAEVLCVNMTYLVEKNMARKITCKTPKGPEDLYYIP